MCVCVACLPASTVYVPQMSLESEQQQQQRLKGIICMYLSPAALRHYTLHVEIGLLLNARRYQYNAFCTYNTWVFHACCTTGTRTSLAETFLCAHSGSEDGHRVQNKVPVGLKSAPSSKISLMSSYYYLLLTCPGTFTISRKTAIIAVIRTIVFFLLYLWISGSVYRILNVQTK